MYAFEFERPTTIAEAVAALGDEDAQPLSGGQTLIPTLRARLAMPSTLVSLAGIEEMKGIRQEGNTLWIGGASVHADVCEATRSSYPGLSGLVGKIGDPAKPAIVAIEAFVEEWSPVSDENSGVMPPIPN